MLLFFSLYLNSKVVLWTIHLNLLPPKRHAGHLELQISDQCFRLYLSTVQCPALARRTRRETLAL